MSSYWAYSAVFWAQMKAQQERQSALQAQYWADSAWIEYPISISYGELDEEPTEEVTMIGPYIPPVTHLETDDPIDWAREGF